MLSTDHYQIDGTRTNIVHVRPNIAQLTFVVLPLQARDSRISRFGVFWVPPLVQFSLQSLYMIPKRHQRGQERGHLRLLLSRSVTL